MQQHRTAAALLSAAVVIFTFSIALRGQTPGQASAPVPLPMNVAHDSGEAVTPALEGWFKNDDGSFTILLGYMNRNLKQTLDIPIGPNNHIEPGGPDYGQPTHFDIRRQWGVFTIKVPKDFGNKKLTWTITANGLTTSIPVGVVPAYQVEPYKEAVMGNTPPVLAFQQGGPTVTGPPVGIATSLSATVDQPLPLTVWVTDKGRTEVVAPPRATPPAAGGRGGGRGRPDLSLTWSVHRGVGDAKVSFEKASPTIDKANGGKASTTATFSAPGDYVLRLQANDDSGDGGGGFQCCWTNALVKVAVKAR
jgi:hypothetical protein